VVADAVGDESENSSRPQAQQAQGHHDRSPLLLLLPLVLVLHHHHVLHLLPVARNVADALPLLLSLLLLLRCLQGMDDPRAGALDRRLAFLVLERA